MAEEGRSLIGNLKGITGEVDIVQNMELAAKNFEESYKGLEGSKTSKAGHMARNIAICYDIMSGDSPDEASRRLYIEKEQEFLKKALNEYPITETACREIVAEKLEEVKRYIKRNLFLSLFIY